MSSVGEWKPLKVLNHGFDREGLDTVSSAWTSPIDPPRDLASAQALSLLQATANPWAILEWWESELQARLGILDLRHIPFIRVKKRSSSESWPVPARMLYPDALGPREDNRVKEAARYMVAAIRQAREYYAAAQSVGVSTLSRPVLYFYGALYLARAAVVALGGMAMLDPYRGHGLSVNPGASNMEMESPWPTLIGWKPGGEFAAFFRVMRWDELYKPHRQNWQPKTGWPKFHILECLRCLDVDWGALPPALFNQGSRALPTNNGLLVLPHQPEFPYNLYLTPTTDVLKCRFYQVPKPALEFMALKYFADLARYHPLAWQELLEGAKEPEGYVFRAALDSIAGDFVRNIVLLLPLPGGGGKYSQEEWIANEPLIEQWYEPPQVWTGHPVALLPPLKRLPIWDGATTAQTSEPTETLKQHNSEEES